MYRSGVVLSLALLASSIARVGAVERCLGSLLVGETLSAHIARLPGPPRESRRYLDLSLSAADTPFTRLMRRNFETSEDLRALSAAGLLIGIRDGRLDLIDGRRGRLMRTEALREPLWRLKYQPDGPTAGYLMFTGWSRTRRLRYAEGQLTEISGRSASPPVDSPVRGGEDPAERRRLLDHGEKPESPSLLLEATGQLAQVVVDSARAICRGDASGSALHAAHYPHVLLAMAAHDLRHDPVMRNLIAGVINERTQSEFEVRAVDAQTEVFTFEARMPCARPRLTFGVPADPFRDPTGWGWLR